MRTMAFNVTTPLYPHLRRLRLPTAVIDLYFRRSLVGSVQSCQTTDIVLHSAA
jgi:hypothetical protein